MPLITVDMALFSRGCFPTPHITSSRHVRTGLFLIWARSCFWDNLDWGYGKWRFSGKCHFQLGN